MAISAEKLEKEIKSLPDIEKLRLVDAILNKLLDSRQLRLTALTIAQRNAKLSYASFGLRHNPIRQETRLILKDVRKKKKRSRRSVLVK